MDTKKLIKELLENNSMVYSKCSKKMQIYLLNHLEIYINENLDIILSDAIDYSNRTAL